MVFPWFLLTGQTIFTQYLAQSSDCLQQGPLKVAYQTTQVTGLLYTYVNFLHACPIFSNRASSSEMIEHRIAFRNVLSFIVYDTETVHLLTRHHQRVPPRGYMKPLTDSSWVTFALSLCTVYTVMQWTAYLMLGYKDLTDVLPLLIMFHYEDNPNLMNAMKKLRSGNVLIMLCILIYFSFFQIYNQDFRSSTIEPFYEWLPDHIRDINPHSYLVLYYESIDFASAFRY